MTIPCHLSRFYLFFMLKHDKDFGQVQVMEFPWHLLRNRWDFHRIWSHFRTKLPSERHEKILVTFFTGGASQVGDKQKIEDIFLVKTSAFISFINTQKEIQGHTWGDGHIFIYTPISFYILHTLLILISFHFSRSSTKMKKRVRIFLFYGMGEKRNWKCMEF